MSNSILDRLDQIADEPRARREQRLCSESPDRCNLCGKSLLGERYMIDGEAKDTPQTLIPGGQSVGQWSYMCVTCFASRGVGIAWGDGQLYRQTSPKKWLQVAGFPPEDTDDS